MKNKLYVFNLAALTKVDTSQIFFAEYTIKEDDTVCFTEATTTGTTLIAKDPGRNLKYPPLLKAIFKKIEINGGTFSVITNYRFRDKKKAMKEENTDNKIREYLSKGIEGYDFDKMPLRAVVTGRVERFSWYEKLIDDIIDKDFNKKFSEERIDLNATDENQIKQNKNRIVYVHAHKSSDIDIEINKEAKPHMDALGELFDIDAFLVYLVIDLGMSREDLEVVKTEYQKNFKDNKDDLEQALIFMCKIQRLIKYTALNKDELMTLKGEAVQGSNKEAEQDKDLIDCAIKLIKIQESAKSKQESDKKSSLEDAGESGRGLLWMSEVHRSEAVFESSKVDNAPLQKAEAQFS